MLRDLDGTGMYPKTGASTMVLKSNAKESNANPQNSEHTRLVVKSAQQRGATKVFRFVRDDSWMIRRSL